MTNISALDALNAALAASDTVKEQAAASNDTTIDFSSYLKSSKNLDEIYQEASQTYGVSVDLLKAMTKQESNFNPNATSRSGAQGLMQLMPATAKSLGVTDPYDAGQNIMGGAKCISQKLKEFNGDERMALAAYNAGSGAVKRYGGIPSYCKTYVNKVQSYKKAYETAESV